MQDRKTTNGAINETTNETINLFSSVTRKRREEELPSGYLEAGDIFVLRR
jgi:hypothetical protein